MQLKRESGVLEDAGDAAPGAQRRWYEEKQKRKAEDLERLGLDMTQKHRWGWAPGHVHLQLHVCVLLPGAPA